MKIALVHNLPSGGAKRHTFEQVRELAKRGHQVTEFAPSTANLEFCSLKPFTVDQNIYPLEPNNLQKKRIPLLTPYIHAIQIVKFLNKLDLLNRRMAKDVDSGSFDAVLVKDCQFMTHPFILQYLSTRSLFQCHSLDRNDEKNFSDNGATQKWTRGWMRSLYYYPAKEITRKKISRDLQLNLASASSVVTNSNFTRQMIWDRYHIEAQILYPGINSNLFRPTEIKKGDYVLSVGELSYFKGYRFIISALARINPECRPGLLAVANSINPSEEKFLRQMASALQVKLEIESIYNNDRLVEAYNQALVFVYAPISEWLGMAPLEAMSCGIPVVAVAEGGVKETVPDGVAGYLIERDEGMFAKKLEQLLIDEPLRKRMGAAGVQYIRSQWTWTKAVDNLEKYLEVAACKR